jgi:hypothetical protein
VGSAGGIVLKVERGGKYFLLPGERDNFGLSFFVHLWYKKCGKMGKFSVVNDENSNRN